MPLYEYQCEKCFRYFEVIQKFSDPLLSECSECGGKVERLLSAPSIRFKGSGWYINDYSKKSSSSSSSSAKDSGSDSTTKAESSSSTAKAAAAD